MTVEQKIQWVALPAGVADDGALRLSAFVAPRLRTDEGITLATFPDFLDWPARIAAATFAVRIDGNAVAAERVGPPADSALWQGLFPPDTPLRPFAFADYADRPFVTFSVRAVRETLRKVYAAVAAAAPDRLPLVYPTRRVEPAEPGLVDLLAEIRRVAVGRLDEGVSSPKERSARVAALLEASRAEAARRRAPGAVRGQPLLEPLPADGSAARHLERALLFHVRPVADPVAMPPGGEHFVATTEFHQMLSALGDHPWLLRRLGLVVDLTVPADAVPLAVPSAPGVLALDVTWASDLGDGSVDVVPGTAFVHQNEAGIRHFRAALRSPDPAAPVDSPPTGLLPLGAGFALEQVDVDGAALKAVNLGASLHAQAIRPPELTPLHEPDRAGIPALRTGGLALVEDGRAVALQTMFTDHVDRNAAVESAAPVTYFAEDLLRGYRLDVRDTTSDRWHSLHRRKVSATASRVPDLPPPEPDEGFAQLSLAEAARSPDAVPDPNGELYVHETLATWDGWSLSAPRPGKALSRDPRAPTASDPATLPSRVENTAFTAMGLSIEARAVPGTLPRLRFGRGYQLRVRTVDLAGNGPSLDEADAAATAALPPGDVQPYLRFEPVAGPTLVPAQRYGEGASLLRLVVRSNFGRSATEYAEAFAASQLVTSGAHPGYVPQDERHVAAPKAAFELAERHGLFDAAIGSDGTPPSAGRIAEIAAAFALATREKGSFDDAAAPGAEVVELSADPAQPQRYVIRHGGIAELPYLPDPFAGGAVFFGLPGMDPNEPFVVTYDADPWYAAKPFRLKLTDGVGPPEWDPGSRVLTVRLPQASSARARVCSQLAGDLGQMGLVRWFEEELAGDDLDRVIRAAKQNRCWLITPWHDLELVHAVQQPLDEPAFEQFEVSRWYGQTSADLFGFVSLHLASTDKIDLVATWTEQVDDPAEPLPGELRRAAEVFELPLRTAALGTFDGQGREWPYSIGEERFVTFCSTANRDGLEPLRRHEFGDTRHRRVTYAVRATTPYREDFPQAWLGEPEQLSRTSVAREEIVLASAPPLVPRLIHVAPTQGWAEETVDGSLVRHRRGGGLRVRLERPWFSSGDGELLGVLVGSSLEHPASATYPYVTLLGEDPIRAAAPLRQAEAKLFRNATLPAQRVVRLLEVDATVTVVPYRPVYDEAARHWFCDIEIDTGVAYLPFVRLALARFQPNALERCRLSPVLLVDLVQTLPDRTLTMTRDAGQLTLTVGGPTYTSIRGPGGTRSDPAALAKITARIERRHPRIVDPDLGWEPVDGAVVDLDLTLDGQLGTWRGALALPQGEAGPLRLVVLERDHLAVDGDTPGEDGLMGRIVYADTIPIDP